jgi:MFS family permease
LRFVFTLGYYLVYAFQLYILTDYIHLSRQHANEFIGLLIVVTFATILVSVALAGWWSDRVGRRKPFLVAASLVVMVALAVPLFFPTVTGMIVFAALKGVGFGLSLACGLALASETLPNDGESAGKDLGIHNVGTNIPQALTPALAALVIGAFGGYQALFIAAIVGVAGSIVAISRVRGVR